MIRKLTAVAALVLVAGLASPATAQTAAPPAAVTSGFASFITDILAGKTPSNISPTMKSQASQMLGTVRAQLAPLGSFTRLKFLREETMQGYHRYHYEAVFAKGTQPLAFVTDANGVIVGFFQDQPPAQ